VYEFICFGELVLALFHGLVFAEDRTRVDIEFLLELVQLVLHLVGLGSVVVQFDLLVVRSLSGFLEFVVQPVEFDLGVALFVLLVLLVLVGLWFLLQLFRLLNAFVQVDPGARVGFLTFIVLLACLEGLTELLEGVRVAFFGLVHTLLLL